MRRGETVGESTGVAISVNQATINTAAVSIKTLSVSGRQVTLALFRQLRESALISDGGTLRGLPWGTVNYHGGGACNTHAKHLHAIWQLGDELRRSTVGWVDTHPDLWGDTDQAQDMILAWAGLGGRTDGFPKSWVAYGGNAYRKIKRTLHVDGRIVSFSVTMPKPVVAMLDAESQSAVHEGSAWAQEQTAARTAELKAVLAERTDDPVAWLRELEESVTDEIRGQLAWIAQLSASWDAIAALPQLFIAV